MEKAFVTTCEALGLGDRTSLMNEIVARKIIELAQRGLRNPTGLYLTAMRELIPTVKVKNPKAPAVQREAEEDWGR